MLTLLAQDRKCHFYLLEPSVTFISHKLWKIIEFKLLGFLLVTFGVQEMWIIWTMINKTNYMNYGRWKENEVNFGTWNEWDRNDEYLHIE